MSDEGYDSRPETWEHIYRVRYFVNTAIDNLYERADAHDMSKLASPEVEAFDIATPKLAKLVYGSDEYRQSLRDLGPALQHHFAVSDHHPEWVDREIEWRAVEGFPGYEVSSMGDVQSVTRQVERPGPTGNMVVNGRLLTANITPKGYLRIQLKRDGKPTNRFVHVLVATTFIPNPDDKAEVNHKNGIKTDNRVVNLEWTTPSENQTHAYASGLREVKYVVHCPELDLTTLGTGQMARALRERGYEHADANSVQRVMNDEATYHGLTFEGMSLVEYRRSQVRGMSLMSLIEMVCDWRAASERVKQRTDDPAKVNTFEAGLAYNQQRFGYSDELAEIILNTARELGML